ncbi:phosphate acyltransferase PlsX [Tuwongella immobilis]|uniref:Phosphate acyltransferase n=1 Tax=Tuwongella immobilis TaxID=692036 RepID=A0A6C2YTT7_9BACT|nr:phosphate acyltransferase PlsX [Tuwongella immobilis]VIP04302.1 fatty acid phospholipid synthesis protein : Phosphate acyltransferase OS=uncultured Acidobacteria bacterium A2 GN=plsX PE=3 SV=1: FA_synthesis [Tuwongella immobilis]VTS05967.1 fatty acid phospholipid synthesis protein : Phosphate acyltransferase OS=uncultured Acidobacteria bacterium A2 GN=plsX PE=3 SV=1: FA_synthesis [Tuwongella immobilis]
MRIALDAMGGDHAPGPIVTGAVQALQADPDLKLILVGDQEQVEACLAGHPDAPLDRVELVHSAHVIGMQESPVEAMRTKVDNSITRCWQLLAEGRAAGIVGAGHTGAMVAGGLRLKRFLPKVRRPAIATVMPTLKGPCIILDVGANIAPKPQHLVQYGVMGSIYAKHILGREQPTIGLMNVGEEAGKGHELAKTTHGLFNSSPLKERFIGNIEGRDIHRGAVDVVVTDGFTGNVVLKVCEGMFEFIMKMVGQSVFGVLHHEKALAMSAVQELVAKYDYSAFGGAPLLGIDGVCIICHGSSKERAIQNAIGVASQHLRSNLNQRIVQELEAMPSLGEDE